MEEINNKQWCVYMHINKANGKMYIGIARDIVARWGHEGNNYKEKNKDGKYKQPVFAHALEKYSDWNNDWIHRIVLDNLTHEEACQNEIDLIDFYKTNVCRWNTEANGYNMTDGGEGTVGRQFSQETREKMKLIKKEQMSTPELNPMFGKYHSEETKEQISNALKLLYSNKENHPMYEKCHSEESKEKMKKSSKLRWTEEARKEVSNRQKERMSNPINTPWFGKHRSESTKQKMSEAAKNRSETHKSRLSESAKKRFEDKSNLPDYLKCKLVIQLTLDGDYITEYPSVSEAFRQTNITTSHISACCKGKRKSANGYRWMYKEDYNKLTQQNDLNEISDDEDEI